MSCFVCRPETFKSVTKVCFQYGLRQPNRTEYPLLQTELDAFTVKVAELYAKNVSIRYEEDAQAEVESFGEDIPFEKITVQDIKYCDCWMYQTCDYLDGEPLFKMVKEAVEWAKAVTPYSKEGYSEPNGAEIKKNKSTLRGWQGELMEKYCLVGVDGNVYAVMGYVSLAMQETGFTKDEINSYRKEAMSGDYNNLLCVSMEYIDKCNERAEEISGN